MRPNDSALPSSKLKKSPLGAIFTLLFAASVAAQTHLDPSQIAPLQGSVLGNYATTRLRDFNSAADHGNGITNAIYSAIADCGLINPCSIFVPSSYGIGEFVPGYQLNDAIPTASAMTLGNITIFDRRYSEARMLVNNLGYVSGLLNSPSGWIYNYYSPAPQNAELATFYLRQWSIDGGNNQLNSALNYADKTNWTSLLSKEISHTPAQHLNLAMTTQSTSIGAIMGIDNQVTCYGGFNAPGDLGCHAMDNIVAQGSVEYGGTLTGSPSTGVTSLTVAVTQGAYTQGAGRFLVKMNAGAITGGTISGYSNGYPSSVSGAGTTWPVSNVIAQLGTNLYQPGVATVTPSNISVGTVSTLTTSSLVCVADQESFEMVYPTAVTATTFTANFIKIHTSNATIASGGLCGYLLDLTADDVTNATYPTKSQTITGTLHFAWPLIASTSATGAAVWIAGGGGYQSWVTRFNASSANGYVLYPFAEVTSVQQAGGLSNTLTVGPNNVAWASGDTVHEFLYPAVHHTFGNTIVESYFPNITASNVFGVTYNTPLQGNETMMTMANNAPAGFYQSGGGAYFPPTAVRLAGTLGQVFTTDLPGDAASLAVGCTSCNRTNAIFAAGNGQYYDFIWYDQGNRHFAMSANSASSVYFWTYNYFGTPFSNTYFGIDSSGAGFISTQQARSNTSANSDASGELVFSNATSATATLQGTYASHPECLALPQFDPGANNRHWITYAATSFTVNFATPVQGTVTYSCAGRN